MPPDTPWPTVYTLPSSPTLIVNDRFSILDRDDDEVPFWDLLCALLEQDITHPKSLIELLDTITVTLRGVAGTDYGFLRLFLNQSLPHDFWTRIWPVLRDLALRMPSLFPEHSIPILSATQRKVVLSREQVACLVVHQFLCTLPVRAWEEAVGFQDFHVWYDDYQPHPGAVKAYLTTLFAYFDRLASSTQSNPLLYSVDEWPITYEMVSDDNGMHGVAELTMMSVLRLQQASTAPAVLGLPDGATVISANKFIGFGRTGTQEETHVGGSLEACPAVLVTPPLKDDQVMVVTGAEAMISIGGYGRAAKCEEVLRHLGDRSEHRQTWAGRTMLFMDALELDLTDQDLGVPVDLQPGNIERDLRKAFLGFKHKQHASSSMDPPMIFTGFWGCRTFGGNPEIKACIQWCAASLARCDLTFICSGEEQQAFADRLETFIADVRSTKAPAEQLRDILLNLQPIDIIPGHSPFEIVLEILRSSAR